MLIPLGILATAGAGGAPTSAYELISSQVLGSTSSSVTFSNLGDFSSIYKFLQIRYSAKTIAGGQELRIRFNGNSTGYNKRQVWGAAGSSNAAGAFNQAQIQLDLGAAQTTNSSWFQAGVIDIFEPYNTSKNTTIRAAYGEAFFTNAVYFVSGMWNNTASVTSITFTAGNDLAASSRFSLYGIKG